MTHEDCPVIASEAIQQAIRQMEQDYYNSLTKALIEAHRIARRDHTKVYLFLNQTEGHFCVMQPGVDLPQGHSYVATIDWGLI